jgi:DNA-binding NtrC family response regulator
MNSAGVSTRQSYRLLVVEDEPEHQLLIRRALAREGQDFAHVQFARDSGEALQFARQMTYDALLVDNRIPGTRGLDLLTELRESGVEAPFVLMTSAGSEDLVVEAMRRRVAEYVIKDSGFWRDLPQRLHRVIESDRQRRRELDLLARLERTNARLDKMRVDLADRTQQLSTLLAEATAALEGRPDLANSEIERVRGLLEAMRALLEA